MELATLCNTLLAILEQFDETVLPLGLYACDDLVEAEPQSKPSRYQEWHKAIAPYLKMQGYSVGNPRVQMESNSSGKFRPKHSMYRTRFQTPAFGVVNCTVIRFSKIKVRKYGSAYRVDIHEERAERWKETDVSGHISNLWKQPELGKDRYVELVLVIGFDKAQDPLGRELLELQRDLKWEEKKVVYLTRVWQDKADRGFGVRLGAWARTIPTEQ
ncbi:hypothetical protein LEP3755_51300 [Leptolyngbya sp. NIES-3755]|nr:hypothetical protein LEP3755_51300 [Leptolyngbya sp. NIES-3755]